MPEQVPAIYTIQFDARPAPAWGRVAALAVALGCLGVLLVATTIPPDASGMGSHARLGLAQCQFLQTSDLPCPSCGMTTSFCWFVRGNLAASVYIQPLGAILALAACAAVWVGLYIALTGRPLHRLASHVPIGRVLFGFLLFAIAAWGWKILLHLRGWDGW